MGFSNRIRLPFKLTRPQFPEDRTVYRKANGETKVLSVVIRKTYEGETDWWPEKWHQRLAIALGHDNITIEGDKYLGGITKNGDYEIDWQAFLDYPTGKAKFSIEVTPFDNTNNNCMTCEEAIQLDLSDDSFPDPLEESGLYNINVAANDNICCYPAVFSITSFNTNYVESASLDQLGNLSIQLKDTFMSGAGILLVTYRVTCPSGAFDEANVSADVEGSISGCIAPSDIIGSSITANSIHLSFTASPSTPDHYLWRLYKASSPGVLVQTGTSTTLLTLSGLSSGTAYKWYVRSQCGAGNDDESASNFIEFDFSTNPESATCGSYLLTYDDPFAPSGAHTNGGYLDCNGVHQSVYVPNHIPRGFCAMQTAPGVPVDIISGSATLTHGDDSGCADHAGSINLFLKRSNSGGTICTAPAYSVWISSAYTHLEPGITVCSDDGLTTPITGMILIADIDDDRTVYTINPTTGVVGSAFSHCPVI